MAAMNRETPQQRIDGFINRCQEIAQQYSKKPRQAGERLLVGVLHDGQQETCPTMVSWLITWQPVKVGGRYEKRKIDGDGATYESREVTVLALLPTGPAVA